MIHESLVYETIDYKPIYYKGYKEVLKNGKTKEDVMGCGGIQALLTMLIAGALARQLDPKRYLIGGNEAGLHLAAGSNLAADIAIFEADAIRRNPVTKQYLEIPPKVIIEIDSRADLSDADQPLGYYHKKIQKLLSFGVEKVVWLFTDNQLTTIASNENTQWITQPWSETINLFEDYSINPDAIIEPYREMFDF